MCLAQRMLNKWYLLLGIEKSRKIYSKGVCHQWLLKHFRVLLICLLKASSSSNGCVLPGELITFSCRKGTRRGRPGGSHG